jgi:hypothetical protein
MRTAYHSHQMICYFIRGFTTRLGPAEATIIWSAPYLVYIFWSASSALQHLDTASGVQILTYQYLHANSFFICSFKPAAPGLISLVGSSVMSG